MSDSRQTETASLLRLAKSGDADAVARLVDRALPLVQRLLRNVPAGSRQDLEQELYVRMLQAIQRFQLDGGAASRDDDRDA